MDFKAKTKLIEAIDDEVNILHRLLHDTFRHMEGIEEVEYTHGPHEKGADFVLTRRDPALGRTHEIGIIAKKGKILSLLPCVPLAEKAKKSFSKCLKKI